MPPKPLAHVQRLPLHRNPANGPKAEPPPTDEELTGIDACLMGSPLNTEALFEKGAVFP
jgi:hypothetical protein